MFQPFPGEVVPSASLSDLLQLEESPLRTKVVEIIGRDPDNLETIKNGILTAIDYYLNATSAPILTMALNKVKVLYIKPNEEYVSWEDAEESVFKALTGIGFVVLHTRLLIELFSTNEPDPQAIDAITRSIIATEGSFFLEITWLIQAVPIFSPRSIALLNLISQRFAVLSLTEDQKVDLKQIDIHKLLHEVNFLGSIINIAKSNKLYNALNLIFKNFIHFKQAIVIYFLKSSEPLDIFEIWLDTIFNSIANTDEEGLDSYIDHIFSMRTVLKLFLPTEINFVVNYLSRLQKHSPIGRILAIHIIINLFEEQGMNHDELLKSLWKAISSTSSEQRVLLAIPIYSLLIDYPQDKFDEDAFMTQLRSDVVNHALVEKLEDFKSEFDEEDEEPED